MSVVCELLKDGFPFEVLLICFRDFVSKKFFVDVWKTSSWANIKNRLLPRVISRLLSEWFLSDLNTLLRGFSLLRGRNGLAEFC